MISLVTLQAPCAFAREYLPNEYFPNEYFPNEYLPNEYFPNEYFPKKPAAHAQFASISEVFDARRRHHQHDDVDTGVRRPVHALSASSDGRVGLRQTTPANGLLEKPPRAAKLEQVFGLLRLAEQSLSGERLLAAIANRELVLHFQPVVTRHPKAVIKLEALVRWEHPVLGLIPPGDFLRIAQSNMAIIDALADWVAGTVVDSYHVLAEIGLKVPLAMNLSTRNLHDPTLPDRLEQRLRAGGMPTQHLCLEITEGAAFMDVGRTTDILSRMRLKGMQLSFDDFGTGYSSLGLLRQIPFSEIKIGRSFVADVATSRESRVIVKSIIDLAANLKIGCVAEGIETAETADLLEQLGARSLQGHLIARAMPIEAIPAWLATGMWCDSGKPQGRVTSPDQGAVVNFDRGDGFHARSCFPPQKTGADAVQLSPRQIEVMQLLSEGYAVKQIARHLNLGIGTVKVHISLAYSALGARNRIDAIRRAGPILTSESKRCHPENEGLSVSALSA